MTQPATKTLLKEKRFTAGNGTDEVFISIRNTDPFLPFSRQAECINSSICSYLQANPSLSIIFERWFVSDSACQQETIEKARAGTGHAVSIIEQPPLDGTKVAFMAWLREGVHTSQVSGNLYQVTDGSYTHYWTSSSRAAGPDSKSQTLELMQAYEIQLQANGCNMADNCIRTWFFVQNIDNNYHGMVVARNEVFDRIGLTAQTHFIASTGIAGRSANHNNFVQFEACAIKGIEPHQVSYIQAPTHLNPTHEYGVRFERATAVDYCDRRHVFVSGTASIDNHGEILYPGDIVGQANRMIENVEALLQAAQTRPDSIMHIIVYLRDIADYQVVSKIMEERFPTMPMVITCAPVCRPGWLVEMECVAIAKKNSL